MYNEYEDAWEVEDEYYVSEEKYLEFKRLFPHLYFPEYQDDYSFFLPVSNDEIAKLLNQDGNVKIGGKLVSYIDVTKPEDLIQMGRLCAPQETNVSTRIVQNNTAYLNYIPEVIGNDRDRKMWVNVKKGTIAGRPATWVEINFRKKGAFGKWKNYSSEASLLGTLRYATGHL